MANSTREVIEPEKSEVPIAEKACRALASRTRRNDSLLELHDADTGEILSLPHSAGLALLRVLQAMGQGRAVAVTLVENELSTQQAAEILNVSRPYVAKLVDEGALPARKVGPHRRLLLSDVLDHQKKMHALQVKAMEELSALTDELGLYESDPK